MHCRDWGYIGCHTDISRDGKMMLACSWDGVGIWDWNNAKKIGRLEIGETASATFHPHGTSLITCGNNGVLQWPVSRVFCRL